MEVVDRRATDTETLRLPPGGIADASGWRHLPGWLSSERQRLLLAALRAVIDAAPLMRPSMPKSGKAFSVLMTNCGPLGWVSDRDGGYRYQATHPETGRPWPPIPELLGEVWRAVASYRAPPQACLVNYYAAGTRLGAHRDADEDDAHAPVVSVSLGDDATFHVGGSRRSDPKRRLLLRSGDVFVLGGAARDFYHGIDRIHAGTSPLLREGGRF
ncbi:MAG: alpha-ketoglutarate-dependent dioxygenase AlkB, partial [Hyphomicrobiaceae bacterium]|nr:alpha-ketoglutarate-dependent dioxygenase AlkB [Hyphomicrobiaceae bacterium]